MVLFIQMLASISHMRYILPTFQILFILAGCNSLVNKSTQTTYLNIDEPKISEINSSNSEFLQAINIAKEHLTKLSVPIDSMYFIGIDSTTKEEWKLRFVHYDNYLEQAEYDTVMKRIDSLEKAGVENYTLNYVPPTGNWGGYDRTLIYSTTEHKIKSDLIDQ